MDEQKNKFVRFWDLIFDIQIFVFWRENKVGNLVMID
jgi:hypothetical protein